MRALLLPIKDLRNSKQRLESVLSSEERFALAQAMLVDAFRAASRARLPAKVFVVTSYEPAMEVARQNGWEVLREEQQTSESASVDFASRVCEERGVTAVLRFPLDLPLARGDDIDDLLATACGPRAVVLVPSREGTGTNAILRTPPTLFPSHFGLDSFAKHREEALRVGAQVLIRRNARLELDVDDESDLRTLLRLNLSGTSTGQWLEQGGVASRLRSRSASV